MLLVQVQEQLLVQFLVAAHLLVLLLAVILEQVVGQQMHLPQAI